MILSSLPADNPMGSKNPIGAVIPTTVSSVHALSAVFLEVVWATGAKAELQ